MKHEKTIKQKARRQKQLEKQRRNMQNMQITTPRIEQSNVQHIVSQQSGDNDATLREPSDQY